MIPLDSFLPKNLQISDQENGIYHLFDERDCYALWAAYAAGRPLLIRGLPGTGKSQMAKAIARHLGWSYISEVVRGNTELSDMHWHYDAIGRLGEAQMGKESACVSSQKASDLDPLNFLSPGIFWWGYDQNGAKKQYEKCVNPIGPKPFLAAPDADEVSPRGMVLLIDEIDKADPDLPNGLLETLGQFQFSVPYLKGDSNIITAGASRLLVIVTTNEERELPSAFVRRCFVHTLKMEDSPEIDPEEGIPVRYLWLIRRGRLHFGERISNKVYERVAELLWEDVAHNRYPPGLAEYIDLLRVISELSHEEQLERVELISSFALKKEVED